MGLNFAARATYSRGSVVAAHSEALGPQQATLGAASLHQQPEAVFSFLYFLKIKISKIYVRFEIFQKYTPVALP